MLQGYNCITHGKSSSSKGGLVLYIDDKYKADAIINLNSYEHWEGLIIKVNGGNLSKTLTIIIIIIYLFYIAQNPYTVRSASQLKCIKLQQ